MKNTELNKIKNSHKRKNPVNLLGFFDKNYLAKWGMQVLVGILGAGIIVYIAYHVYNRFSPKLELVDAIPTTVTEIISADAYIMRDEYPVYSSVASGSVAPALQNGGRIARGAKIAEIYALSSPDIETRLSEIDKQIALLSGSGMAGERSLQSTVGIENEIFENIFTIRSHCISGDYSDALSMRTTLLVNINKKQIYSGQTDYAAQLSRLENEKAQLRGRLGVCLDTVYADKTGYYFSDYDGYGKVFSSDKIDSMTYDEFFALTESEPETKQGVCVGSVVRDFYWYAACAMTKAEAASIMEKNKCDVLFTYSDTTVSAQLYRIIPQIPGDGAVAVFRCENLPTGFDYTRMQPVKISALEYTGYEIPADAVRIVSGFEGVYVLNERTVAFRRINVIYRRDGKVLCTGKDLSKTTESSVDDEIFPWIKTNDIVIISGKDLYSGKIVD